MTEEKKYIYAIISAKGAAGGKNPIFAGAGLSRHDISIVPFGDLVAVVSDTHLTNFDKLDKKELAQSVAVHEQVNTNLMKDHDVIPMRFGMIVESGEEIIKVLEKAYIQFKTALERVAGKAEFIVEAFWDKKKMLEKIIQENTEIQKLQKEVKTRGKILGFSSKIKLGKQIFDELESFRKEYIKDILSEITSHFPDFSIGKLVDSEQKESSKEMILNYSFLIEKKEESKLEFILNRLAEKYKDKLKFKYIGPMAAYSFSVINLSLGNFDLVDNARKTLGLNESVAFLEIKNAYYKLAVEHHPDKHEYKKDQDALDEAAKKMKDIVRAHEVLNTYCKHYLSSPSVEKKQICSFKKEDVENSIIIKEN